jgi:hypothetical protein
MNARLLWLPALLLTSAAIWAQNPQPRHPCRAALASIPSANPSPPPAGMPALTQIGNGELRWFGLLIYRASLWTPNGRFQGYHVNQPVVLQIEYQREIPVTRFVDTTLTEWERMKTCAPPLCQRWVRAALPYWRNSTPGDRVSTVVWPGKETRFYLGNELLGIVPDPDFGPAFLSIWIGPDSPNPELRRALLGEAAVGTSMSRGPRLDPIGESATATTLMTGRKPQTGHPWPAALASVQSATSEASRASVTARGPR